MTNSTPTDSPTSPLTNIDKPLRLNLAKPDSIALPGFVVFLNAIPLYFNVFYMCYTNF